MVVVVVVWYRDLSRNRLTDAAWAAVRTARLVEVLGLAGNALETVPSLGGYLPHLKELCVGK